MGFWSDLGKGFSSHIKAIEFIAKHSLWLYFLYPIAIAAILYLIGFFSFFALGGMLGDKVVSWIGLNPDDGGWQGAVAGVTNILVSTSFKMIMWYILGTYMKYIVLIICSPILALLSERVEEIITGNTYPFNLQQFLLDIMRGILVVFRNLFIETGIMILCLFITLIPILGWVLSIFTIPTKYIFSCYFLGFSMMDYTYERRKMSISQGASFTRKHKGIAISNGFVFQILLLIPLLGMSLAPILSCVAATLAVLDADAEDKQAELLRQQQLQQQAQQYQQYNQAQQQQQGYYQQPPQQP
ncbi:MAG: EI24 domain-containing protein [Bacteroidia bacterium]